MFADAWMNTAMLVSVPLSAWPMVFFLFSISLQRLRRHDPTLTALHEVTITDISFVD